MKRLITCNKYNCSEPIFSSGLCEKHSMESLQSKRYRDDAIHALHYSKVDNLIFTNIELRDELNKMQTWWNRACDSLNNSRIDPILKDEAKYAIDWCISLTQELIHAERASRSNMDFNSALLDSTRTWVWERFGNLEQGLMSNGIKQNN